MYNWNNLMRRCNYKLSKISAYSVRNLVNEVIDYIKKEYEKNPTLNSEDLEYYILKKYYDEEKNYVELGNELSNCCIHYLFFTYLKEHPEYTKNIYNRIKNKSLETPKEMNNYNLRTGCINSLKQLLEYTRNKIKEEVDFVADEKKLQQIEEKLLFKMLDIEIDFLNRNTKKCNTELLRDLYFNLIKRYGLEEKYVNNHIREFSQIGLRELVSPQEKLLEQFEKFWDEENLSKMDMDELNVVNLFWYNKRAKELSDINKAFSIVKNLGIYESIVNGDKIEITDEQISNVMQKLLFLKEMSEKQYERVRTLPNEKKNVFMIDETKDFIEDYQDKYKEVFDKLIPESENNMEEDFKQEYQFYTISSSSYQQKTNLMFSTIIKLLDNKTIKNWGVIEDIGKKDDEKILIGIDLEGFNVPIRVHMEKNTLLRGLHNFNKGTVLPVYQGQKDFSDGMWIMKSHLLYNVDKDYKKRLKAKSQEYADEGKNGKAVSHLMYIADNKKVPPHFREKVPNSNSTAQVKRFVDINTKERYVLKQGKIITEEDYQKMFNETGDEENNGGR